MLRLIHSLFGLLEDAKSSSCEEEQTLIDTNILQIHLEAVFSTVYLLKPSCRLGYTLEWLKYSQSTLEKGAQCSPPCAAVGGIWNCETFGNGWRKKWFMAEMRWNAGWGFERGGGSSVKNCCWLLDENEDICVDLEGYIDTKAPPSPSAVQQSLSREKIPDSRN